MHPPIWKTAPFLRLIPPLIGGILLQWYLPFDYWIIVTYLSFFTFCFLIFYFLPLHSRYKFRFTQAMFLQCILLFFAMFITQHNDYRNREDWFGHSLKKGIRLVVRIDEPPVDKAKSLKAACTVKAILVNDSIIDVTGKMLVYFSKDTGRLSLQYGDLLLIDKLPEPIKNAGNPGSFDYKRYLSFQQVFHQTFLSKKDWLVLKEKDVNRFDQFIFSLRNHTIQCLHKYIKADNKILGIAEALLIGYKEDLDKDLVQAYSNTGVVHIIAISGLHLGLIYIVLVWIFNRIPFIKKATLIKIILIISSLWLFALLTGASASVLRSAVMFSCIVPGKLFKRTTAVYNSLAASAFILLCYDPCFLWDVGFQLSYLAVVGIVALQQPVFRLIYLKNKMLLKVWEMLSVTIAAQIASFPICLYYFHQFPNLFFITNLLAVPISTVILFAEILLIIFSWMPLLPVYIGKLVTATVWLMNAIIECCNDMPFSLWDNIYANVFSTLVLYAIIICIAGWLFAKRRACFKYALAFSILFSFIHALTTILLVRQKKMIVYNIPKKQAVDFIAQQQYQFYGDSTLAKDGLLKNFHLRPARIAMQLTKSSRGLPALCQQHFLWQFYDKKILLVDRPIHFIPSAQKTAVDILIISKDAVIDIDNITCAIKPAIIVFDASNSLWKIAKWKRESEALLLPCFSIPDQGAFVYNIE